MTLKAYRSALKNCVKFIEKSKEGFFDKDEPYIDGSGEESFDIEEDKIYPIPSCEDVRKLGFVDGGNGVILKSADFNISLNRVAGVLYIANKWAQLKKTPQRIEFYSATVLDTLPNDTLAYITRFFPVEPNFSNYLPINDLIFPLSDPTIRQGFGLPSIETFGGLAMRFAEWSYARNFIGTELEKGDIFIRDGSLQAGYTGETTLANNLYRTAVNNGVIVTGLSKTCRLITGTGNSLNSAIYYFGNKKFPDVAWYFHPIYRITKAQEKADLYFVKLHKNSVYSFRFDILLDQAKNMSQEECDIIISNLANNSNDLSYPGYPYGLIKVDQMAAVGIRELELQKVQLVAEFDPNNYEDFILPRLRSLDAHNILNIIRK